MREQLITQHSYGQTKIYPKTFIQNILDKDTGQSLQDIISGYNCYYLSYLGDKESTRMQVPSYIRRQGLQITYVLPNRDTVLEYYDCDSLTDSAWRNSDNWRILSNFLIGDISISSSGNWIVNGKDTGIQARGETGITPLLAIKDNKLHVSYDNGKTYSAISDNIIPIFRWYDVSDSIVKDNSGKIQISMDLGKTWSDLSPKFTNSLRIKQYVKTVLDLPLNATLGDIYGVGPVYSQDDTDHENPKYNIYVYTSTGWVNNGSLTSITVGITQELGDNTDKVISQKVVSDNINYLKDRLVVLSQQEYDDLEQKDEHKFYFIYEEE